MAASSLGKTRSKKAYDALIKALERDSHMEAIRALAFDGLAELKDERALPVAIQWTKYGRPQRAREAATFALGKLGENKREALDTLIDLLDDPWLRVRMRAIGALEELKDLKAIPALEQRIGRERDDRVVRVAREAILRIHEGKSAPDDVKKLRESLDKLEEDNRHLKDRLERLEKKLEGKAK